MVVLTLLWPLAMRQVKRLWLGETRSRRYGSPYSQARIRALPIIIAAGVPMIVAGWVLALDYPQPGVRADGWQLLALFSILTVAFVVFLIAPCIVLFNRPRRLVPQHLRNSPGYLAERRGGRS